MAGDSRGWPGLMGVAGVAGDGQGWRGMAKDCPLQGHPRRSVVVRNYKHKARKRFAIF